jgi:hypothetical protein
MSANLYLPGDDLIDQALAEFMGYFWCRYYSGQVVGERIVRFLVSPEQFEEAKQKFGLGSIGTATGQEPIEQLAFKAVPAYHSSRDAMAAVEAKLHYLRMWELYVNHLRDELGLPVTGILTAEQHWNLITAEPRARARAAFLVIDAQRPKQQALL